MEVSYKSKTQKLLFTFTSLFNFTSQLTWGSRTAIAIDNQLGRRSTANIVRGLGTKHARPRLREARAQNVQDYALLEALAKNVQD